jgi:nicotinamidase/pyrazinamidase
VPTHALVVVDLQNDFLHGGALAVPGGDEVVDVINHAQERFDLIIATQDWHPRNHVSFAANHPGHRPGDVIEVDGLLQILWPVHCVEHTRGAALCDPLDKRRIARVFYKGVEPCADSYSAFFDNAERRSTGLGDYLRQAGARELFLAGLATDYCVSYSARDAQRLGFNVFVIVDGCRGLDSRPGDTAAALEDLRRRGVHLIASSEIPVCRPDRRS